MRCNDSRDREYTSRWPMAVRPDTMFERLVNGLEVCVESLSRLCQFCTALHMNTASFESSTHVAA
jgi:hypothetical protein